MGKKKPSDLFTITDSGGAFVGEVPGRSKKGALSAARLIWGKTRCEEAEPKEAGPTKQKPSDEIGGDA